MKQTAHDVQGSSNPEPTPNRRKFLGQLGGATAATVALGAIGLEPQLGSQGAAVMAQNNAGASVASNKRARQCYEIRQQAAEYNRKNTPKKLAHENNADDELYPTKFASFTKGLPHHANGEVDLNAYNALLTALSSGRPEDFDAIPLGGQRKLTNPQSGHAFDLEGGDAQGFVIPPAPKFNSREMAAEIAENYWMALLRDVPFSEYASHPVAHAAAADLTAFGADFKGPKTDVNGGQNNGVVTPELLFRGRTPGDKVGPQMSQFFYQPCFYGANELSQKMRTVKGKGSGGRDYLTDFESWLDAQRGGSHTADIFDETPRFIRNGRDIGQWVHVDVLYQAYFHAYLVISGMGAPVDDGNPYKNSANQVGFGTFGDPHIAALLCEVATRALKAVWYQKWMVHRRLRPEVFAARVDRTLYHRANYPVHPDILNSLGTASRLGGHMTPGNAFLPMAFPEGSPTHPAYGAGHATVSGACVTILKAWFDESYVIPNPVVPDETGTTLLPYNGPDLTVGGELNKIASNVANGRNIAGVHWRSDSTESHKLGEAIAISVLRDQKATYNERFGGFRLTKFDGTTVVV